MKQDPLDIFAPMDDATKAAMNEFWPQDAAYAPPIQEPFMYGTLDAVLAERERCARKAEDEAIEFHPHNCGCSGCEMSTRIAAAIRSGK